MYECLEDASSGDDLTIEELIDTLIGNQTIDPALIEDLRERYDDDVSGDTTAVFCKFWEAHGLPGDPMYVLSELELV